MPKSFQNIIPPQPKGRAQELRKEVSKVLGALGLFGSPWLTDIVKVGDFDQVDIDDVRHASEVLGVHVSMHDLVVDVAQRLKEKK